MKEIPIAEARWLPHLQAHGNMVMTIRGPEMDRYTLKLKSEDVTRIYSQWPNSGGKHYRPPHQRPQLMCQAIEWERRER